MTSPRRDRVDLPQSVGEQYMKSLQNSPKESRAVLCSSFEAQTWDGMICLCTNRP
jgi:hypothetical protein